MARSSWMPEEVEWLIRAWQEIEREKMNNNAIKENTSALIFNKQLYERFLALSGGSTSRTAAKVANRKDLLRHSYKFIRAFMDNNETGANLNWFALSNSEQRELMKIAGGQRVIPIEKRNFSALDNLMNKSLSTEKSCKNVSDCLNSYSDSDRIDKSLKRKKQLSIKRAAKRLKAPVSHQSQPISTMSTLEDESSDFLSQTDNNQSRQKHGRIANRILLSKTEIEDILKRQRNGLADFVTKRADERFRELEWSIREREADQMFYASEAEKDRALLRNLFFENSH
ncbi:hypothetical protein CCR75_004502 [Bremia lactucae]|uniref:Uncharacterized protein n=1 Tax=Bremia lactucae TaxID=4779 RepID=A0A976FK59_BRELC|nr:hypothetical protein CCR75_004502 [Bremia lactucae]